MSSPSSKFTRWSRDVLARIAGYRTHKVIAEWGPQCALEGRADGDDRLVVIDVLDPKVAAHARIEHAFKEGAKTALGIKHPNLLQVIETGHCPHSGLLFVASEHPGQQTLASILGDDLHLSEPDAVAIVQQVAEGLAAASERRLSHGRLRPSAIGLDEGSTPRIAGFGLPRPPRSGVEDVYCLAPEQVSGVGEPDPRGDVYALGVLFYRCLTGRYPFVGETYDAIAAQHAGGSVGDPRDHEAGVGEGSARVVKWMTALQRQDRYASLHAVSLDMLRLLGGQAPRGPAGGRLKHPQELVELLRRIEERRPGDATARGLWGTGPAYAFKVVLATQEQVLNFKHFGTSTVCLGRSPKVDFPIDNPIVSREHAEIVRIGGHFLVEALSKTNPTEVNGIRIEAPTWIRPGQTFLLSGKFNVRVFWAPYKAKGEKAPAAEHDTKSWVSPPTQRLKRSDVEEALAKAKPTTPALPSTPTTPIPKPTPKAVIKQAPPSETLLPGQQGYLVYHRGGAEVRTVLNQPFQVGRSAVCDLRLRGKDAPHKAAIVIPSTDGFRLYSLVSDSAYVRLNGEPVGDLALLEIGDEILVGETTLQFLS